MPQADDFTVSRQQEIDEPRSGPPHVVLLGAGASKAALPSGDAHGRPVPVLREVADLLGLCAKFPPELQTLAEEDFEAAYSALHSAGDPLVTELNDAVLAYFADLRLPEAANLYDRLLLGLRPKDVIFTFNWDPFLVQARHRLAERGVNDVPDIFFLHGNVGVGSCPTHRSIGYLGVACPKCGEKRQPIPLLFPVAEKNYQDGGVLEAQWKTAQSALESAFMFTIFGSSAPATDVEAKDLLLEGWFRRGERPMEQLEIIDRPGRDRDELYATWAPFIHSHHYDIHESFESSWIANHPRRTLEAFENQYCFAKFIENNPIPSAATSLEELIAWFSPLRKPEPVERRRTLVDE